MASSRLEEPVASGFSVEVGEGLTALLSARPLCRACLGRLYARVGKGLSNRERGERVLAELGLPPAEACWLCEGLVEEIPKFADLVTAELRGWELDTFLVGSRIDPELLEREEVLWAEAGLRTYEPIKAEVNREVGKRVEEAVGRPAEFGRPDVTAVVDTMLDHVDVQVAPLYVYGRYRKLRRGIPQTRWPCRHCRGRGCEECNGTGKRYETSVEEIVAREVMAQAEGEAHAFHGMGREDIDARMLGGGRPFVFEVQRPRRRRLDLGSVARAISVGGQVEVLDLRPSRREEVAELKQRVCDKTYGVRVRLGERRTLGKVNEALTALVASRIVQRTPTRVAHRRADLERHRRVRTAEVEKAQGRELRLRMRTETGTYVKEVLHGDEGRTTPSLAGLLGTPVEVVELDVLEIHDEDAHGESV